jgi:hypothetical protein
MLNRERIVRYVGRQLDNETCINVSLLGVLMDIKSGVLTLTEPIFSGTDIENMIDSSFGAVKSVEHNYFCLFFFSLFSFHHICAFHTIQ